MKSWSWILLIIFAILIKWATWYPGFVERNYTYGIYPWIAKLQRILLGWIPFSIGDLFYIFLVLVILFRSYRFFRLLLKRQLSRAYFKAALQQAIFFFLFIYVTFNILWGLNYNRQGIASQLELKVTPYSNEALDSLMVALHQKLNFYSAEVEGRDSSRKKKDLFKEGIAAYQSAETSYSFLRYQHRSVKPSLFSYAGNYLGFQGYYNPFSGEAQVNTTIPRFLEPFVTTHEIAHQLGYAKENEANFVAFLACRHSANSYFRYSMYFDMYNYASAEMMVRDSARARELGRALSPKVKADILAYREFYRRHRNPAERVITWGYGHFLKANNQPAGKRTYNEVVAWLIAYYKQYGIENI